MMNAKNILITCALFTLFCLNLHAAENTQLSLHGYFERLGLSDAEIPLRYLFGHIYSFRRLSFGQEQTELQSAQAYERIIGLCQDPELISALFLELGDIAFIKEDRDEAISFLKTGLNLHQHSTYYKPMFGNGCVNLITLLVDSATTTNNIPDDIRTNYKNDARKWAKVLKELSRLDENYVTPEVLKDLRLQLTRLR